MVLETGELKRGACIVFKGAPMMVVDVSFSTPTARGANSIAKTRLRNLVTGQLLSESIRGGEKFAEVDLEQHPCTFLYGDGSRFHFMDNETFEQFEFSGGELGDDSGYLRDGLEEIRAILIDGRIVSIKLPPTVDLEVIETDPALKGATATAQLKPAKLETGIIVQVPPYLSVGEKVRVDTRDGHFVERVKP